jgi:hypothetical protein
MGVGPALRVLYFCGILAAVCTAQNPASDSVANAGGRPRVFPRGQSAQIVSSSNMPTAQLNAARFRLASGEEIEGMELTLEKYESAFENLSLPQMREVWPTLDRQHERAFKSVFAGFKETAWTRHMGLECSTPKVIGEAANTDCRETLVYGNAKGKTKEVGPVHVAVLLKRKSNTWVVEDMKGE